MGSTLTVDNIVGATTAANVKLPAGHVVQVVEKVSTASNTFSANSYADHDELAITP